MELEFVSDPYALSHFSNIRYVEYMGVKWKAKTVTPNFPRIIVSLGEEYNHGEDET